MFEKSNAQEDLNCILNDTKVITTVCKKEENCLNKAKLCEQGRKLECNARADNSQCIWRFKWKFGGLSGNFFTQNLSIKSPPIPLFHWYQQSTLHEKFLNLSMKCLNSAFNAQGSRVIILVVPVGAVKIYVAAVEAFREKERQDETQFTTKTGDKTSLGPNYFGL